MKRALLVACVILAACGGQVREEGKERDKDSPKGKSGSDRDDDGDGFYSEPLPACEPGPPAPQSSCPYVASGRCYPDKTSACACECEKTKGSVCISGFPGELVEVSCP